MATASPTHSPSPLPSAAQHLRLGRPGGGDASKNPKPGSPSFLAGRTEDAMPGRSRRMESQAQRRGWRAHGHRLPKDRPNNEARINSLPASSLEALAPPAGRERHSPTSSLLVNPSVQLMDSQVPKTKHKCRMLSPKLFPFQPARLTTGVSSPAKCVHALVLFISFSPEDRGKFREKKEKRKEGGGAGSEKSLFWSHTKDFSKVTHLNFGLKSKRSFKRSSRVNSHQ